MLRGLQGEAARKEQPLSFFHPDCTVGRGIEPQSCSDYRARGLVWPRIAFLSKALRGKLYRRLGLPACERQVTRPRRNMGSIPHEIQSCYLLNNYPD